MYYSLSSFKLACWVRERFDVVYSTYGSIMFCVWRSVTRYSKVNNYDSNITRFRISIDLVMPTGRGNE